MRRGLPRSVCALALLLSACGGAGGDDAADPIWIDVVLLGGETTDISSSASSFAFSAPLANISAETFDMHVAGDAFFAQAFVPSGEPGQAENDGLGPAFNNASCEACHQRDGRGTPPADTGDWSQLGANESLFLAISLTDGGHCEPQAPRYCAPEPVPEFGTQLFHRGVLDARSDTAFTGLSEVWLRYQNSEFVYPDGARISLRRPQFEFRNPYDQPGEVPNADVLPVSRLLQSDVVSSPRLGMPVFGLGLIEAIAQADIDALADAEDADGDGISGRVNQVLSPARVASGELDPRAPGRFGWKANNVDVEAQSLGALHGDMGITNSLFPQESVADTRFHADYLLRHPDDDGVDDGGLPEASAEFERNLLVYVRTLHVPARREVDDPAVRAGARRFAELGCDRCHHPNYTTARSPAGIAELEAQSIWPFSDFLLHDMGDGLADGRSDHLANAREWRTRPLWGLGLTKTVNPSAGFLHDGRARTIEEAVLWHGGEAQASLDAFAALDAVARNELIAFLNSL